MAVKLGGTIGSARGEGSCGGSERPGALLARGTEDPVDDQSAQGVLARGAKDPVEDQSVQRRWGSGQAPQFPRANQVITREFLGGLPIIAEEARFVAIFIFLFGILAEQEAIPLVLKNTIFRSHPLLFRLS